MLRTLYVLIFMVLPVILTARAAGRHDYTLTRTNYHGWPDSVVLGNGKVEAIIVPAIGRVMQFRFAGEVDGPFWENRELDGKAPNAKAKEWINFGGDKTWPSPQADWGKIADRNWPPPPAFDSMAVTMNLDESNGSVRLVSPVDPFYGVRTIRLITLHRSEPMMQVRTIFNKVEGAPRNIGVWVITQLKDPVAVFAPVPEKTPYRSGYDKQSDALPLALKVENGLLSLKRDLRSSTKVGNDAGTLLWFGEKDILRIDSPRVGNAEYPDHGCSAEIYTNPDPNTYVELELLGPLQTMKTGDQIERTSTYTLMRRSNGDTTAQARQLLRLSP